MPERVQKTSPLSQSHLPITYRHYPELNGTVLGFDFGEQRIGVAVGETILKQAHPLTTVKATDNAGKFKHVAELISKWQPCLLVVGLPTHLDGTEHHMTHLAKKFAQRLEGRFNLPVVMVDERLSSYQASQSLKQAGISGISQKGYLDQVSALTILQAYFTAR